MAVDFGEGNTSRYYTIAGHADLDIPNADWALGIQLFASRKDGTSTNEYAISKGSFNASNFLALRLNQSTGTILFKCEDSSGKSIANIGLRIKADDTQDNIDSVHRWVVVIHDEGGSPPNMIYEVLADGTVTQHETTTKTLNAMNDAGDWLIGVYTGLGTNEFWENRIGGFFRADGLVTEDHLRALGAGYDPIRAGIPGLKCYIPFKRHVATQVDIIGGHNAVATGSGFVDAEHFPEIGVPIIGPVAVAGASPQNISATGIPVSVDMGAPTVVPGAVNVAASGIGVSVGMGSPVVVPGGVTVAASGISVSVDMGAPTVVPGAVNVAASGIPVAVDLGAPTVVPGAATVTASGISVSVDLGSPVVVPGAVNVAASGISVAVDLGAPTVVPGAATVTASGILVSVAMGAPTVVPGAVNVAASGISVAVDLGAPTVVPGAVNVAASGIGVSVGIGAPVVVPGGVTVAASGISVSVDIGTATASSGSAGAVVNFTAVRKTVALTAARAPAALTAARKAAALAVVRAPAAINARRKSSENYSIVRAAA